MRQNDTKLSDCQTVQYTIQYGAAISNHALSALSCSSSTGRNYFFVVVVFPPDTKYCHTLHVMDTHGDSVSVTKRCVALDDCLLAGCAEVTDGGYRVRWNSAP